MNNTTATLVKTAVILGGMAVTWFEGFYVGERTEATQHPPKVVVDHQPFKGYVCDPPVHLWNPTTGEQVMERVCDMPIAPPVIQPTPDPNATVLIQ